MKILKYQIFILSAVFFLTLTRIAGAESDFETIFSTKNKYQDVVVEKVLNADTIKLASGEIIKLIGLRSPELPRRYKIERDPNGFVIEKPLSPMDPIEQQSFKFTKELIKGKHIRLEFDVDRKDNTLTTIAYAFLLPKNIFVNAEILRQGYAYLETSPTDTKYEKELSAAYQEARREKRGLQGE